MRTLVAACVLALLPVPGWAQTSQPPVRRLELGAGIGFLGGASLGDADADLRSTPSGDYRLFQTSSRLTGRTVLDLRAGFDFTPRFGLEARALYGHPELQTEVSGDAEGAPGITAVERLDQYLIDGGIVVRLNEFSVGGLQPFVAAGGGYLRQLHEGLTVTETGSVFYVGGGARHWLFTRSRGIPRAMSVRGDVRLNILTGGISLEDEARRNVSAGAVFSVVF